MERATKRLQTLIAQIREDPGVPGQLAEPERSIVDEALQGDDVHAIAARHTIAEEAVWRVLDDATRLAGGREPERRVLTGGMGGDVITGDADTVDIGLGDWGGQPDPGEGRPLPEE